MTKAQKTMETVTTSDGQQWSAKGVEDLRAGHKALLAQRDKAWLDLALLRGKIHILDMEQRPGAVHLKQGLDVVRRA